MSLCPCQGPAGLMDTALWLSCASAGAQPGVSGSNWALAPCPSCQQSWGGRAKKGRGRAGCLSLGLEAFMSVLAANPVPKRMGEAGASPRSQDRLVLLRAVSPATFQQPCSPLPLSPCQSVPEQSPSCSCSIPSFEGLLAWTRLQRKE